MSKEAGQPQNFENPEVDLQFLLHQAEVAARVENKTLQPFAREWAVTEAVGSAFIQRAFIPEIQNTHPEFSNLHILEAWQDFMEAGFVAAEQILEDLQQSAPKRITIDFSFEALGISSISHEPGHVLALNLSIMALVRFFTEFLFAKHSYKRTYVLKKFEAVLAHEFYHIFQINRYPEIVSREKAKDYWDRRIEYSARLYSLRHLRRQSSKTFSGKLALWRSRAHIITRQLNDQIHVRDEVNKLFGVKKPSMRNHLYAIFVDDPKRVKRKLR